MIWSIVIIVGLIACSAFFAAAETALTAASRPKMHGLEGEGNRRAVIVNRLRLHMEQVIGTLLLGNNLVNIMASALATGILIEIFGARGVAYATAVMTVLIVVFGEVMPKTFAINNADRLALAVAPAMQALVRLVSPVIRIMQILVRGTLHLLGASVTADLGGESAEAELRGAIDLHADATGEEKESGAMLHSILDLGDVIIGVLHAKALLRAVQASAGKLEAIDIIGLALPPWFVPESTSLLAQLRAFRSRREHFALVVDEYGALMGIVTLEDIIEEIVGDIEDEHDLDGTVTIRDLNREFDWRLPDDDVATIAGLVLHEARRIPDPGQVFTFHGFRFEVLERQRNQIRLLKITPPEPATAASAA
jgi:Mg2+/Co2+ transporter CorB